MADTVRLQNTSQCSIEFVVLFFNATFPPCVAFINIFRSYTVLKLPFNHFPFMLTYPCVSNAMPPQPNTVFDSQLARSIFDLPFDVLLGTFISHSAQEVTVAFQIHVKTSVGLFAGVQNLARREQQFVHTGTHKRETLHSFGVTGIRSGLYRPTSLSSSSSSSSYQHNHYRAKLPFYIFFLISIHFITL